MKNNSSTTVYFSAKLPVLIIIACVSVAVLGLASIILCLWRILSFGAHTPWEIIKYAFLFPISAFCIFAALSVAFHSEYITTKTQLIQTFGLFRARIDIKDITSIVLNNENNALTIYAGTQTATLLLYANDNERFTRTLLNANENIQYSFILTDKPE